MKMLAIILIVAGALLLAYKGFSYKKKNELFRIGDAKATVTTTERQNVPPWVGFAILGAGVALLIFAPKKAG